MGTVLTACHVTSQNTCFVPLKWPAVRLDLFSLDTVANPFSPRMGLQLCPQRPRDKARGRDSWCWPKGARPLGTRILQTKPSLGVANGTRKIQGLEILFQSRNLGGVFNESRNLAFLCFFASRILESRILFFGQWFRSRPWENCFFD